MKCSTLFFTVLIATPLVAQDNLLATPDRWTITPDGGWFAEEDGESVLRMSGGNANLNDVTFDHGTIAFEMKLTHHAAFVGLQFRAGRRDAEHVYFRPHRSGQWDAIQYQPIMNGSSTWQLYSGDGFTAPVELPHGKWFPVRLEVRGAEADLYVGDAMVPTMQIALERGVTSGAIVLTAGFRGGAREGDISGAFRRLTISPAQAAYSSAAPPEPITDDAFIRTWSVSDAFPLGAIPATTLPAVGDGWTTVEADRRGLVNLTRHIQRVGAGQRSAVIADVVIHAARDVRVPLNVDFSDDVSVFLNDRLLFTGTNSWESRYPYYLGAVSPDVLLNQVWLDLSAGDNHLSLLVSEQAFGWGFAATMDRPRGVAIRSP